MTPGAWSGAQRGANTSFFPSWSAKEPQGQHGVWLAPAHGLGKQEGSRLVPPSRQPVEALFHQQLHSRRHVIFIKKTAARTLVQLAVQQIPKIEYDIAPGPIEDRFLASPLLHTVLGNILDRGSGKKSRPCLSFPPGEGVNFRQHVLRYCDVYPLNVLR